MADFRAFGLKASRYSEEFNQLPTPIAIKGSRCLLEMVVVLHLPSSLTTREPAKNSRAGTLAVVPTPLHHYRLPDASARKAASSEYCAVSCATGRRGAAIAAAPAQPALMQAIRGLGRRTLDRHHEFAGTSRRKRGGGSRLPATEAVWLIPLDFLGNLSMSCVAPDNGAVLPRPAANSGPVLVQAPAFR